MLPTCHRWLEIVLSNSPMHCAGGVGVGRREKIYYSTTGRQGGPPGLREENDPAGRVLLEVVALEGVPCVPIFP
jgi:hypothetical protein